MKRHSFDIVSAGFGAIFVWLGIAALIPDVSVPLDTIWPVLAVLLGISILYTAVRNEVTEESPVDEEM